MPFKTVPLCDPLPKHAVLKVALANEVKHLFHANTVTTSLSFLQLGGLVSRARVERDGLPQTKQTSDEADRAYHIFDKIFLDPTDLHERFGKRNLYGPVTFVFDVEVLTLDCVKEARVTRYNPANWNMSSVAPDRCWLTAPGDVSSLLRPDAWQNHVVLSCDDEVLPFTPYLRRVILDDPQGKFPSKVDAHQAAHDALAQRLNSFGVSVERRVCPPNCVCVKEYRNNLVPFLAPTS